MEQTSAVRADALWVEQRVRDFSGNVCERIGNEWMLITAGQGQGGHWNTMTASWGGLGVLWGRDVAFMFIRPTRHTFAFANESPLFTLSFFPPDKRSALEVCGKVSGRDTNKAAAAGLSPIEFPRFEGKAVAFDEAREVLVCQTLYSHDFDPARILPDSRDAIEPLYPEKDYHRLFIGEVVARYVHQK